MSDQVSVGTNADNGNSLWHSQILSGTDDFHSLRFWCGNWYNRTLEQLHAECLSVVDDLERLYPHLKERAYADRGGNPKAQTNDPNS